MCFRAHRPFPEAMRNNFSFAIQGGVCYVLFGFDMNRSLLCDSVTCLELLEFGQ